MQDTYDIITTVIFMAFMLAVPLDAIYQRHLVSKGKTLAAIELRKGWMIYDALISIVMGLISVFFIFVAISLVFKTTKLNFLGWLLLLSAILFFGNIATNLSPWRAQLILTDRGILSPSITVGWHRVKKYEWVNSKAFALRISVKYLGVKIPIPLYDFIADAEQNKFIDKIINEKVVKGLPSKTVV